MMPEGGKPFRLKQALIRVLRGHQAQWIMVSAITDGDLSLVSSGGSMCHAN